MEKKSIPGANQSSKHGNDQAERNLDSDDSYDNSMLVEKEDSHSDIDTIEEEVDLSMSEGSEHEDN